MLRPLPCTALVIILAAMAASPSFADRKSVRTAQPPPPLKDCTRVNGRSGYYGNMWCTPAEQQAWDRAEARRLGR
jgi:hypothetical protein